MKNLIVLIFAAVIALATAEVYYLEEFDTKWTERWVQSNHKEEDGTRGDFVRTAGKFYNDAEADAGVQTSQDARFYAYTSKFDKPFSNKGKDLVVQYTVKHEQKIDCGGGYIKVLPSTVNQKSFNGDSDYNIMFGPDICGQSTKRVHLIFNYEGKNHLLKKTVPCETDEFTHLYTLILHSDNTYEIEIDQKNVASGSLKEDWDMLESKEIKDPEAKKPSDWVDAKEIADPEDKKPEGYDDIPAQIADPEATKPEDWDDELDGEWEAPQIANPEFKGVWSAKKIPNPEYKGEWVHPLVPNPKYKDDDELYLFEDNGAVGFELWQVKAGTIFGDIIITDSIAEAKEHADKTWKVAAKGEKAMKEEQDKKQREEEEEERKKREAEQSKEDEDAEEDDDEDDDDVDEKDEL